MISKDSQTQQIVDQIGVQQDQIASFQKQVREKQVSLDQYASGENTEMYLRVQYQILRLIEDTVCANQNVVDLFLQLYALDRDPVVLEAVEVVQDILKKATEQHVIWSLKIAREN